MKKFLITLTFSLVAALASFSVSASGYGAGFEGKVWSGNVNAGASSMTTGGSMSETGAHKNGYAFAGNANAGGGSAYAGGNVHSNGIDAWSGVDSFTLGGSAAFGGGNYAADAAGGNGTDVSSYSSGTWAQGGFGGYVGFGFGGW